MSKIMLKSPKRRLVKAYTPKNDKKGYLSQRKRIPCSAQKDTLFSAERFVTYYQTEG